MLKISCEWSSYYTKCINWFRKIENIKNISPKQANGPFTPMKNERKDENIIPIIFPNTINYNNMLRLKYLLKMLNSLLSYFPGLYITTTSHYKLHLINSDKIYLPAVCSSPAPIPSNILPENPNTRNYDLNIIVD